MTNMSRTVDIKMEVLHARVLVHFGDAWPFDQVRPEDDDYTGITLETRGVSPYPFTVLIHSKCSLMSTIAHEATHAASYIMKNMGCVPSFEDDELKAYIIQHICKKCEEPAAQENSIPEAGMLCKMTGKLLPSVPNSVFREMRRQLEQEQINRQKRGIKCLN